MFVVWLLFAFRCFLGRLHSLSATIVSRELLTGEGFSDPEFVIMNCEALSIGESIIRRRFAITGLGPAYWNIITSRFRWSGDIHDIQMKNTRLKTRIAPGEVVTLTVMEEIQPGHQIVIEFGNGNKTAREHTFSMPETVKFDKNSVDRAN